MKGTIVFMGIIFLIPEIGAQDTSAVLSERLSFHFQATVINQTKPSFDAPYSGANSLITKRENQSSITSTFFAGLRLWRRAVFFVNPEVAGGSGLSQALGVAASTNGETFRVGSTAPKIYLARMYFRQMFALSNEESYQKSDFNQLAGFIPKHFLAITIGRVNVADFFDNNKYSHDPRTQFMSWALMGNGAWDFPANTRGYTPSVVLEWVTQQYELRYGLSQVPRIANGSDMNDDILRANSQTLEFSLRYGIRNKPGTVRLLAFFTNTNLGNYRVAVNNRPQTPRIENARAYGNSKYGFGINTEQALGTALGVFLRASWNDGNNETWTFTEIDHTLSGGLMFLGNSWKRPGDRIGLAAVVSGISKPHRDYLKAGGRGFMLGDGDMNYALEQLAELYYAAELVKGHIFLSGAYQFLVNPGYNKDRKGPVHVFSVRLFARI
jgi:high affinity Mn2+ porin